MYRRLIKSVVLPGAALFIAAAPAMAQLPPHIQKIIDEARRQASAQTSQMPTAPGALACEFSVGLDHHRAASISYYAKSVLGDFEILNRLRMHWPAEMFKAMSSLSPVQEAFGSSIITPEYTKSLNELLAKGDYAGLMKLAAEVQNKAAEIGSASQVLKTGYDALRALDASVRQTYGKYDLPDTLWFRSLNYTVGGGQVKRPGYLTFKSVYDLNTRIGYVAAGNAETADRLLALVTASEEGDQILAEALGSLLATTNSLAAKLKAGAVGPLDAANQAVAAVQHAITEYLALRAEIDALYQKVLESLEPTVLKMLEEDATSAYAALKQWFDDYRKWGTTVKGWTELESEFNLHTALKLQCAAGGNITYSIADSNAMKS